MKKLKARAAKVEEIQIPSLLDQLTISQCNPSTTQAFKKKLNRRVEDDRKKEKEEREEQVKIENERIYQKD